MMSYWVAVGLAACIVLVVVQSFILLRLANRLCALIVAVRPRSQIDESFIRAYEADVGAIFNRHNGFAATDDRDDRTA